MTTAATNVFPISELVGYVSGIFDQFVGREEDEGVLVFAQERRGKGDFTLKRVYMSSPSQASAGCR